MASGSHLGELQRDRFAHRRPGVVDDAIADRLLWYLRHVGAGGMSRKALLNMSYGERKHISAAELSEASRVLLRRGLIVEEQRPGKGTKPVTLLIARST